MMVGNLENMVLYQCHKTFLCLVHMVLILLLSTNYHLFHNNIFFLLVFLPFSSILRISRLP